MKKQNINPEDAGNLRQKAEVQLKLRKSEAKKITQEADMLKLIHELQVHQIELEMQNEEHSIAKEKAEEAEEKYTALFDFAPSAYFNLTPDGEISELNLAGAKMLGNERKNLISSRLVLFMSSGTSVAFHDFLLRMFSGKSPAFCEVAFLTNGDIPIYAHLSGTLADDGIHCLITAVDISDRKHAEKSLRDSEIKYRTLADSGAALIWTSGTDKHCNYFNEPWLKFTGRTLEQEMGNGWAEGVHPDDFQYCVEMYNGAFDLREPFEMEYRLKHHDGSYRWILDLGKPRCDSEGNFIGYIGHCYDINTKKQAEEALRESEEINRRLLATIPDLVIRTDLEGNIKFLNEPTGNGSLLLTKEELIGRNLLSFIHETDLERAVENSKRMFEKPLGVQEYKLMLDDGQLLNYEVNGDIVRDGDNNPVGMVYVVRNITGRKQDEELLRRKEHDLRESQRIAHVGSWRLDVATNEVNWTEELYHMYGFDPSIPPPPYTEHMKLFTPESWKMLSTALARTRETGIPYTLELETIRIDGSNGWMWVRGEAVIDSAGKTFALWGAAQDITEQKNAEVEIRWRNEDLQLINTINQAANSNENVDSLIEIIATQFRKTFNSHLLSIFLPDEGRNEMRMQDNTLAPNIKEKIEKLTGRSIPEIRLKMDSDHPFKEVERSWKGQLALGKEEVTHRLAGYLKGTTCPVPVQKIIKKLLPALCEILEYRSSAAVPLILKGEIMGYLELGSRDLLTERDLERIQTIADQLAAVIFRYGSERKLRESEERMSSSFSYAAIGMAFVTPDGRWVKVNPAFVEMLGYTEAELLSKTFQDITHPDDLANDLDYVGQMLAGTIRTYQMEKRYYHKNGNIIWVLLSVSLVHDHDGRPLHFISQIQDISERKQAEEFVMEKLQLEKLHRMINEESLMSNNHDDFINYSLRALGTFFRVSRTFIFEYDDKTGTVNNTFEWCAEGVTPQIHELVNFQWDEIHWWRDTLAETGLIKYSNIEDIPDEVLKEILRPQGILSILVVPFFMNGSLYGFMGFDCCSFNREWNEESICILRDISIVINKSIELNKAKTALSENEKKFRMLYETMAQGVVYQDNTGKITLANPAAERILGLSLDQMQGRTSIDPRWHTIQQDGSPFPGNTHPAMIALVTGKENKAVMGVFNPTEENYKWINVNAIPEFGNGDNKPFRVFTTFEDITELKNAFDELNKTKELLEFKVEERTRDLLDINAFQKAILDNAPIAILTTDLKGTIKTINPAGIEMTGYSSKEAIGMFTPLHLHDRNEILQYCFEKTGNSDPADEEVFTTALEDMLNKTTEWHWIRKNGQIFPVKISISSLTGTDGNLRGYLGLILDVSREKVFLDSLRESEERFHKMFQEHSAVMLLINPEDGGILQANDSAVNYYGLDFTGTTININDINSLSPSKIKEEMGMAVKQRRNYFIFPHRLATGEIRTVEVHSTPIEISGKKVLFSIIHDITERKLAEDALMKSEAENRAIIQAVPDLMFRIKRDGTFLDSRSRNESSLYVPKELFTGKKVSEVLPPELARQSMQAIGEAFTRGEVVQYEYTIPGQKKDNYFENRMIAISDDEVLSIIRDITYRKESDAALKMQTVAFEAFALAIIITDIDGRIRWANSAFTKLTGYSVDEAICKMPGELIKSDMQDKEFYKTLWDTILGKKIWSGELINRRKDGSLYNEEQTITPVLDPHGNISSFIAIKIDITERKQLYQELADEKRRLADIINGTNVGTWEWNIQTGETVFNQQWAGMLGYTLDEISPVSINTWMTFAHPEDLKTSGELLEKHFKGDLDYYSIESRMMHKNGEWIWVQDKGKVHEWDPAGKPILMSGTHIDITRQKRVEAALLAAKNDAEKANLAKSEFLSRMSHELRTPMNSILGFAQLMEMGELNPKQKKSVAHIMNSGKHLLGLINEVLDISSIEAGRQIINQESLELISIINETTESIEFTASKKKVTIEVVDSPDKSLFVLADRLRLKQILINLLYNAIKYNNEGGSVTIQTTVQPADEQGNAGVRISISDTGMGINPEDISKLFKPFGRIGSDKTDTEGTGLGLMVVKKLTEAMGGRVGVESVARTGSTFWIELPLARERQPEISPSAVTVKSGSPTTKQSITILYIEDNPENIELVEEIIEEHRSGIRLVTSIYGRQSVRLAKEHQPGLILLDLNLPDIHGIEVLKQLMADPDTKAIPVIIISADAMPFQVKSFMKAGTTDYLTKPLDVANFLKTIDRHIKKINSNTY